MIHEIRHGMQASNSWVDRNRNGGRGLIGVLGYSAADLPSIQSESGRAIVVIGIAPGVFRSFGRFDILLDEYSLETETTTTTSFIYNTSYGPPKSANIKYFVYRVPAGIYTAELGANLLTFAAPGGRTVMPAISHAWSIFRLRKMPSLHYCQTIFRW